MVFHRLGMFGIAAPAQNSAVNNGMKRLDAPAHNFGKTGMLSDIRDGNAGVAKRFSRSTGRKNFDISVGKKSSQCRQTGFVRNRDQGNFDRNI